MYYLLPEDLQELDAQIQAARDQIDFFMREVGKSREGSAGNMTHDNPVFEEAQRQSRMWSSRIAELSAIRNGSHIVNPDEVSVDEVGIGVTVVLQDYQTKRKFSLKIRGFMSKASDEAISYQSPLAQKLMGKRVGEFCFLDMGGDPKFCKIIAINK